MTVTVMEDAQIEPIELFDLTIDSLIAILTELPISSLLAFEQTSRYAKKLVKKTFREKTTLIDRELIPDYRPPTPVVIREIRSMLFDRCGKRITEFDFGIEVNVRLIKSRGFLQCLAQWCPGITVTHNWTTWNVIKYARNLNRTCQIETFHAMEELSDLTGMYKNTRLLPLCPKLTTICLGSHAFNLFDANGKALVRICEDLKFHPNIRFRIPYLPIDLDDMHSIMKVLFFAKSIKLQIESLKLVCTVDVDDIETTLERSIELVKHLHVLEDFTMIVLPSFMKLVEFAKPRLTTLRILYVIDESDVPCFNGDWPKLKNLEITAPSYSVFEHIRKRHTLTSLNLRLLLETADPFEYVSQISHLISSIGSTLVEFEINVHNAACLSLIEVALTYCTRLEELTIRVESRAMNRVVDQAAVEKALDKYVKLLLNHENKEVCLTLTSSFSTIRYVKRAVQAFIGDRVSVKNT